jgi:hypothetical protein
MPQGYQRVLGHESSVPNALWVAARTWGRCGVGRV